LRDFFLCCKSEMAYPSDESVSKHMSSPMNKQQRAYHNDMRLGTKDSWIHPHKSSSMGKRSIAYSTTPHARYFHQDIFLIPIRSPNYTTHEVDPSSCSDTNYFQIRTHPDFNLVNNTNPPALTHESFAAIRFGP
jgi:hypothetical protein